MSLLQGPPTPPYSSDLASIPAIRYPYPRLYPVHNERDFRFLLIRAQNDRLSKLELNAQETYLEGVRKEYNILAQQSEQAYWYDSSRACWANDIIDHIQHENLVRRDQRLRSHTHGQPTTEQGSAGVEADAFGNDGSLSFRPSKTWNTEH